MSLLGLRNRGDSISEDAFKFKGRDARYRYATMDGTEYAISNTRISPDEYRLRPGEHFVTKKVWKTEDGTQHSHIDHHLAMPIAAGTWAKIEKRQKAAREEPAPHPWSALAHLLSRRGDPKRVMLPMPADEVAMDRSGAIASLAGMRADDAKASGKVIPKPWVELKSTAVEVSPAGFAAYFAAKGINITIERGDLWAESGTAISDTDNELMLLVRPLLIGHFTGKPAMCNKCDEAAITIIKPRAPACAKHAQ